MALRYLAVRDHGERIAFCTTKMQRSDALTKSGSDFIMYRNLFDCRDMVIWNPKDHDKPSMTDCTSYAIMLGEEKAMGFGNYRLCTK